MKRYQYGQNFQTFQSSKFPYLTPLGFIEVAPGETLSGKFTTESWSDTTDRPILNRTYMDTAAFYVPYRLLDPNFPDFIAGVSDVTPPMTTGTNPFFFEKQIVGSDQSGECGAWNRRAYNLIWNKFFRPSFRDEVDLDQPFPADAAQRPTTFHESVLKQADVPDEQVSINLANESVSIDDLREGFAQDRWNKIRAMYGNKYSDYLAALGVNSSWGITDEPELIGKASKDWQFQTVNATVTNDNDTIADPAGYFLGKHATRIRNTFCPEHGLIVMLGVARMEMINREQASPHLAKYSKVGQSAERVRELYYSPEFETVRTEGHTTRLWNESIGAGQNPITRMFEEYRKPSNQYGSWQEVTNPQKLYFKTATTGEQSDVYEFRNIPEAVFNGIFTGNMGGESQVHYCSTTEVRMTKKSPVRPPQRLSGVS